LRGNQTGNQHLGNLGNPINKYTQNSHLSHCLQAVGAIYFDDDPDLDDVGTLPHACGCQDTQPLQCRSSPKRKPAQGRVMLGWQSIRSWAAAHTQRIDAIAPQRHGPRANRIAHAHVLHTSTAEGLTLSSGCTQSSTTSPTPLHARLASGHQWHGLLQLRSIRHEGLGRGAAPCG
jgi:hypothetical protein